jgi:hypothetical protein
MKHLSAVVCLLALSACASRGGAEDFTWLIECPKTVERGAEFEFAVRTVDAGGQAVKGTKFRYQIQWTGGSANPFRFTAASGATVRLRARRDPGPAAIIVSCENREGREVKVLEFAFEVK